MSTLEWSGNPQQSKSTARSMYRVLSNSSSLFWTADCSSLCIDKLADSAVRSTSDVLRSSSEASPTLVNHCCQNGGPEQLSHAWLTPSRLIERKSLDPRCPV